MSTDTEMWASNRVKFKNKTRNKMRLSLDTVFIRRNNKVENKKRKERKEHVGANGGRVSGWAGSEGEL